MAEPLTSSSNACFFIVGEDGLARWTAAAAGAWVGLIETHKRLVRELEAELVAAHGLSLSALELLGRLAGADPRELGLSTLAAQAGLSLSRVSRIVDGLVARGLVNRRSSAADGRAKNACLTDEGMALLRRAQAAHFRGVQGLFFDRLEPDQIAGLAETFARLAPDSPDPLDGE
ncbi:MAG TPA: MarR family transcriptional regulator [Candidatus Dormibacteraeota bacterium]|jgi:DNA-binding MarR family transcriptional regulator|nr:MarR family transcriptional regulator [Candidatus Dormibacteraeota bacterium]